jgi:hypothetical protein
LTIKVRDINDNYPKFLNVRQLNFNEEVEPDECEQPIYETYDSVEENSKISAKISQVTAIDLDKSRNVTYKIVHTTDKIHSSLSIDKYTGKN